MKFRFIIAVLAAGLLSLSASAAPTAKWGETPSGMPYVEYNGSYKTGNSATDPYFLLGNYRMNLLTHVSGTYQLMSGERVWSRFNADPERADYGRNRAVVKIDDKSFELVGSNSSTSDSYSVTSGIGFTRYDYVLDGGIKCSRMISVMPSENVNEGNPSFLLTVTLRNTSNSNRKVTYEEVMLPCFVPVNEQNSPVAERSHRYKYYTDITFRCVTASFDTSVQKYVKWTEEGAPTMFENAPKPMFMYSSDAFLRALDSGIYAVLDDVKMRPGQTKTFKVVIGIADGDVKKMAEDMLNAAEEGEYGAFASMWKSRMPDFRSERDNVKRREMYWNAHALEASAVYDSYFGETYVPAGGDVNYHHGRKLSSLDHIHAVLPLCYTNPALAKSALRFVMKHSDQFGRIADGSIGSGHLLPSSSDQCELQLSLFHAVSEYLRITGDSAFLEDFFEVRNFGKSTFTSPLQVLENCFFFLRDESLASDGGLYHAMASAILPEFIAQLKASGRDSSLFINAMEYFCATEVESPSGAMEQKDDLELSYLVGSDQLDVSDKRDCLDILDGRLGEKRNFAVESHLLLGALSFDRIEASSLARRLSFARIVDDYPNTWKGSWTAPSVMDARNMGIHVYSSQPHAWALYCYYRMLD